MANVDSCGGPSPEVMDKNHTVSFTIRDEESGEAKDGIRVVVRFSDGTFRDRKTNRSGKVLFEYVPEGLCDALFFHGTQAVLREKQKHTLRDGETLSLIAERESAAGNGIAWQDIAAFNWGEGSRNRVTANEQMRDHCGCARYNSAREMVYTAEPGRQDRILIPEPVILTSLKIDTDHPVVVSIRETPPQFISCGGIPYLTFQSGKSFIAPNAFKNMATLKEAVAARPDAKLMLFGHTDLIRDDGANKVISERRAKSVFSFITKDPDYWVTLYRSGNGEENEAWGAKTVQIILNYLNPEADLDLSNDYDKRTRQEINKRYSIDEEEDISDATLKEIFTAYMEKMLDGLELAEDHFVPLKHAGCGAFNPVFDIKKSEEENRRVTFFLFDEQRLPVFPCAHEDLAPCKRQAGQFDADSGTYRGHREFRCCFYDTLARDCKGEVTVPDIIAFDAHMHFMTSHCTPLPLLWNQLPVHAGDLHIKRGTMDNAGKLPHWFGFARGAWMGAQKTLEIAEIGIKGIDEVYRGIYAQALRNNRNVFTPMIAMPMDMSFSHLDGYKGNPVYIKVLNQDYYKETYYEEENREIVPKSRDVILWPDEVGVERPDILETPSKVVASGRVKPEEILTRTKGSPDQKNEGFYYYWDRQSELDDLDDRIRPGERRVPRWFKGEEMDMFNDWDDQRMDTIAAAITYPFQYMPMYHYEPRRWMHEEDGHTNHTETRNKTTGNVAKENVYPWGWAIPFDDIATTQRPGTFIGFKMYTALGYKPCDPKLPTLKKFYARCQEETIPVLCHCSPSGMCTHDIELYYELEKGDAATSDYRRKVWSDRKKDWYYDRFVSPTAWEETVLSKYPDLKLCLAHFGGGSSGWKEWKQNTINMIWQERENGDGPWNHVTKEDEKRFIEAWYHGKDHGKSRWIKDIVDIMEKKGKKGAYLYRNFYTDISYHFIKDHKKEFLWIVERHPIVKERVMFGTDWYMTELDNNSITDFVGEAKPVIDEISRQLEKKTGVRDDLWVRFTRTNPMNFYGIRGIADMFAEGLKNAFEMHKETLRRRYDFNMKFETSKVEDALKIINNSDIF